MYVWATRIPPVPPRVLVIAGTHSAGAAGLETDLRTLALLGVYAMSAITSVNAQSTHHVLDTQAVSHNLVAAQIDTALGDVGADAVKIGQLATAPIVTTVAERLRYYRVGRVVLDPVLASSTGRVLLDDAGRLAMRNHLFPLVNVLTPNIPEAELLLGMRIASNEAVREAARQLHALGPRAVLVKGGHREGPPVDVLYDGQGFVEFPGRRVGTLTAGGTGCTLASALAGFLAQGMDLPAAVATAKDLVTSAIANALPLGRGRAPCNPWAWIDKDRL